MELWDVTPPSKEPTSKKVLADVALYLTVKSSGDRLGLCVTSLLKPASDWLKFLLRKTSSRLPLSKSQDSAS
eukprot:3726189-Amphidinium_carterae.2